MDAQSTEITLVSEVGMCIECLDQPASLLCVECADEYCDVCFGSLHRKGNRAKHDTKLLNETVPNNEKVINENNTNSNKTSSLMRDNSISLGTSKHTSTNISVHDISDEISDCLSLYTDFSHRLHYIPLRQTDMERELQSLLESALNVSEYVEKVDSAGGRRNEVICEEMDAVYNMILGLCVANDVRMGKKTLSKDQEENAAFFQTIFELGRRHKIRNPDKQRTCYGKLLFLCQDSCHDRISEHFGFDLRAPIRTVRSLSNELQIEALLDEPLLEYVTAPFTTDPGSNGDVRKAWYDLKEQILRQLLDKYSTTSSEEDVLQIINSIGDHHAYLYQCLDPLERIQSQLHQCFAKDGITNVQIGIENGLNGSRLTHSHATQVVYIDQTFTYWKQVQLRMNQLWFEADYDTINNPKYSLRSTGQGIHRMQSAPNTYRTLSTALNTARKLSKHSWVGSSAIHLGDTNVPNALSCIDKYAQLERILRPIDRVIQEIQRHVKQETNVLGPWVAQYYDEHELVQEQIYTPHNAKYNEDADPQHIPWPVVRILMDFFKHGFDGSGADDYFSAGSCIDGRLTSCWNWCNILSKRSYYMLFLALGHTGFDG